MNKLLGLILCLMQLPTAGMIDPHQIINFAYNDLVFTR